MSLILGFYCLRSFGFSSSKSQVLLYPIFVLLFFFCFVENKRALPSICIFLLAPIMLWGLSSMTSSGLLFDANESSANLALLEEDVEELGSTFALFQRYKSLSRLYDTARPRLIKKKFNSSDEKISWLRKRKKSSFLISGSMSNLQITLAPELSRYFSGKQGRFAQPNSDYLFLFHLPSSPSSKSDFFYTAFSTFPLSSRDYDLILPFLSWLSKGLEVIEEDTEYKKSSRNEALELAAYFDGPWISSLPLASANLLLGTRFSIEARSNPACAERAFKRAASLTIKRQDPVAYAAIYNNAGVHSLRYASSLQGIKQAEQFFWQAADVRDKNGKIPGSAQVAYGNLESMYRNGLL